MGEREGNREKDMGEKGGEEEGEVKRSGQRWEGEGAWREGGGREGRKKRDI